MKAVILAGGLGIRLRPLTLTIPKVMVEIKGKPLLWHHLQLLKKYQIKDVWICLHYLPEMIQDYFKDGSSLNVKINYSCELTPLGTAGALKNPNSKIKNDLKDEEFLVVYGDNYTNFDYFKLTEFHKIKRAFMTIGLYQSNQPWTKGIVETNSQGRITKMVEKPPKEEAKTDQVNAGIYVCDREVLDDIPEGYADFGFHIIPKLLRGKRRLYGLNPGCYVQDAGTAEGLKKARKASL